MATYLLAYDLRNESDSQDYEPLWKELKRMGGHKTQLSVWLVASSKTPKALVDHIKQYTDADDRIWVSRVRKDQYWYSNAMAGTNDWLNKNPPD